MIQLTAEIQVFSRSNGEITNLTSNIGGNNVSCDISELKGKHNSVGGNPFILGVSKFGDGSVLTANKVDYFIGREISGDLGYFNNPYTIKLTGNDIKSVTIVFDTVNGGYPKSMSVDGTYFTDDDATFTISDTTIVDFWRDDITEHTIVIYGWNKPNRPLIIQGIYTTPTSLKIDRRNLISVDSNIIDRSDISLPSWGVISNRGNITFNDIDGEVLDYAENGLLTEGQEVNIYLEDTLSKKKTKVGSFATISWDYDNDAKITSVSLSDDVEALQNIDCEVREPSYSETYVINFINETFNILKPLGYSYAIEDITKTYLADKKFRLIPIEASSVWARLDKICSSYGLYIYASSHNRKNLIISSEFSR